MNQIPNIEEARNSREVLNATNEILALIPHIEGFNHSNINHKVDEIIHHQLQKAHQDWLREEIVKLEGMKKDAIQIRNAYFPNVKGEPLPNEEWSDIINWKNAYNSAIQDLLETHTKHLCNRIGGHLGNGCCCNTKTCDLDRYQAELDQDNK